MLIYEPLLRALPGVFLLGHYCIPFVLTLCLHHFLVYCVVKKIYPITPNMSSDERDMVLYNYNRLNCVGPILLFIYEFIMPNNNNAWSPHLPCPGPNQFAAYSTGRGYSSTMQGWQDGHPHCSSEPSS
jgi:hypothetical protein